MSRVAKISAALLVSLLGCANAPRIEPVIGATRVFSPSDRFAAASTGVLGAENPDFDEPALESLREVIEKAIGWRGLTMAPDDAADWLASCAFRKRIIWKGDITRDPVVEPWRPQRTRVLGPGIPETQTRGAMGQEVPKVEPWVETIVELRLRSRRTGTVGWSFARIWGRNRSELSEDELKQTLEALLAQVKFNEAKATAPADAR